MSEILQSEETVRLYEYEEYKPDLDDYISHHGILGMKWGKRNGPPYPLSSKISTGHSLKKGTRDGGGSYGANPDRLRKKAARANAKAAKATKKAAQAGNSFLHPFKAKKKDKLQTKAFKAQAKANKLNSKLDKAELKEATKKKIEDKKFKDINDKVADKLMDNMLTGNMSEKEANEWLDKLNNAHKNGDRNSVKSISDGILNGKTTGDNAIANKVKEARETGKYEMEFLERNLDQNQKTGELLKGKDLDDSYRRYLQEKSGRELDKTKYGAKENPGQEKKSLGQRIKEHKVAKQRKKSLEKARQTKAANVEKKKAEAAEQERISKMREEAIKKADIVTMYKNADHFSRSEIEDALNRKGTLDRLATEVAKMQPQPAEKKPSKIAKIAKASKESIAKGASEGFKSTLDNVARNALSMTLQEIAVRAAGGKPTKFNELSPAQKTQLVYALFRSKKK